MAHRIRTVPRRTQGRRRREISARVRPDGEPKSETQTGWGNSDYGQCRVPFLAFEVTAIIPTTN
jgi:hypothetical protein